MDRIMQKVKEADIGPPIDVDLINSDLRVSLDRIKSFNNAIREVLAIHSRPEIIETIKV